MTTYYITKYALSNGGKVLELTDPSVSASDPKYYYFKNNQIQCVLGKTVFTDPNEARQAVVTARDKKIASLEKQIAKLRKI